MRFVAPEGSTAVKQDFRAKRSTVLSRCTFPIDPSSLLAIPPPECSARGRERNMVLARPPKKY
jgi:hypothetical protein